MALRFRAEAAQTLREAVTLARGIEVFAIGDVDADGHVRELVVHARGNRHAVPALIGRARRGQVLIHNHPSGVLEASDADLGVAHLCDHWGLGMIIVDNEVSRDLWVVEPPARPVPIDAGPSGVIRFFEEDLPRALPGFEPRAAQVEMACAVAEALAGERILLAEAGTGTGKSLAYLVPAALWARANGRPVAIATFTRALQGQLVSSDLPILERAGLDVEAAVLYGQSNYLCKRKLSLAVEGVDSNSPERRVLEDVAAWADQAHEGTFLELGVGIDADLQDRLSSDPDQTLATKCPFHGECFFFGARRRAQHADLLLLNQALLLLDLQQKERFPEGGGFLPYYDRAILDEAHHLEDAATLATSSSLTYRGVRRAVAPLLPNPKRKRVGALASMRLNPPKKETARYLETVDRATVVTAALRDQIAQLLSAVANAAGMEGDASKVLSLQSRTAPWEAPLSELVEAVGAVCRTLDDIEALLPNADDSDAGAVQPRFELKRAVRRLRGHLQVARLTLGAKPDRCNWLDPSKDRAGVALRTAPVEVGPMLHQILHAPLRAAVHTSATLTVRDRFDHFRRRVGLDEQRASEFPLDIEQQVWSSPFRYREQALLVLPKDLPAPDHPEWLDRVADVVVQAVGASGGGVFVLCTSYATVDGLATRFERASGHRYPVLRQEPGAAHRLLEAFRHEGNAVLFGTDSFWEGVSVPGEALRMVIVPRLPFGVPTEPLSQARWRLLQRRGLDPFREDALPRAVLRLRQGFGRLIRTRSDRGVVLLLDRRLHQTWYGRVFLASLPDADRSVGPQRVVQGRLKRFWEDV